MDIQQQYPLSPKKFWKKLLPDFFGSLFVAIIPTIPYTVAVFLYQAYRIAVTSGGTFADLSPEEVIVRFVVPILIGYLFLYIVSILLHAWYIRAYIRNYHYAATDDFITIKKGVFAPAEIHVQYSKIQDVYVDQDPFDRIMGLYDVHLATATAASATEAHIDGVDGAAAEGLKTVFLERVRSRNSNAPSSPVVPTTSETPTLNGSQTISSKEYPIRPQWIYVQMGYAVGMSAIGVLFAAYLTLNAMGTRLVPVISVATFVVIFMWKVTYASIWKKHFQFAFLPDSIQYSTKVVSKSEQHMLYTTIQDVIVQQGFLEQLLHLSTVRIQNAAGLSNQGRDGQTSGISIPGQTPEDANKLAEIIRSIALQKNTNTTGL